MNEPSPRPPAALEVADAVKRFSAGVALDRVSFAVRPGELFGLVGPDGAGKTTTIRALAGLLGIDHGSVRVLGRDPLVSSTVRDALGVMPQHYSLYGDLSVEENLRFFSRMYCLSNREYRERSRRLLDLTRLAPFVERRASALSGGMYKKLALACALLHEPSVLLLDEPTNGVDPVSRREFWDLLRGFAREGMAIVLSTPYMDEAARCHRVGLIHQGRLLLEGDPAALLAAFPNRAFRVEGGDRNALVDALGRDARVVAMSPTGERVRIVVAPDAVDGVGDRVAALGGRLVPTAPDFEDLFLSRLREESGDFEGAAA